jgi:hypothetical protein
MERIERIEPSIYKALAGLQRIHQDPNAEPVVVIVVIGGGRGGGSLEHSNMTEYSCLRQQLIRYDNTTKSCYLHFFDTQMT